MLATVSRPRIGFGGCREYRSRDASGITDFRDIKAMLNKA
jgi:hypothetical protein